LRRASVFQRAYTGRKSVSSEYFTLYILLRQRKAQAGVKASNSAVLGGGAPGSKGRNYCVKRWPLVGFVVSKKVIKGACQRNLAKRRMREAYRHLRSSEKGEKGVSSGEFRDVIMSLEQWYALVWVINEKVLNAKWDEICKKMEESLLQANRRYGEKGVQESKRPSR
jgi:ribonuclease P protein component